MNLLREEETWLAVKGKNRSMEEQMKKTIKRKILINDISLNKPQT